MRWPLIFPVLIAACTGQANQLGNPLLLPVSGIGTGIGNVAYNQRRGRVEVIVKSNFEDIKNDICAGDGDILTQAMDAAGVPLSDRPTRIIQLQSDMGLYANAPGPLVTALMVYGS